MLGQCCSDLPYAIPRAGLAVYDLEACPVCLRQGLFSDLLPWFTLFSLSSALPAR